MLIGMPSSGKCSVGKLLADKIGCDFIDTDELITDKIKMPIKDFFSTYGEEKFREVESENIRGLVGRGGIVIATGGGAILRNEYIANLKYNGRLYFIDRPLDKLIATDTRPLSSDRAAIEQRYKERYQIYRDCCDEQVEAETDAQAVADRILENF